MAPLEFDCPFVSIISSGIFSIIVRSRYRKKWYCTLGTFDGVQELELDDIRRSSRGLDYQARPSLYDDTLGGPQPENYPNPKDILPVILQQ